MGPGSGATNKVDSQRHLPASGDPVKLEDKRNEVVGDPNAEVQALSVKANQWDEIGEEGAR